MSPSAHNMAGELSMGQVGIANLRVLQLNPTQLAQEMRERIERAPQLFQHAAVVLDFGSLTHCPSQSDAQTIIDALNESGVHPVAIGFGTSEIEQLARSLNMPTLARFRAEFKRDQAAPQAPAAAPAPSKAAAKPKPTPAEPKPQSAAKPVSKIITQPIRSGQQMFHEGDLIILSSISPGAEVIATGCIHVYGALRGRALAGARGDESARIFCQQFNPELVAIAGQYKVQEDLDPRLNSQAVQTWLDAGTLHCEQLKS